MEPIDRMNHVMHELNESEVDFICYAINTLSLHESRVGLFEYTDDDGTRHIGTAATHPVAHPNNLQHFGRAFVVETLDLAMPDLTDAGKEIALVIRAKVE